MHQENYDLRKVEIVNLVTFILGFLDAFLIYILSSYFSEVLGSDNVGVFYLAAYSGVLFTLFFLQPLIRRIGKARILYLFVGITILASALLTRLEVSWLSIGVVLVFMVATNASWVALDILLESFSLDRLSGRIRGLHLTIMNGGILLAPFLSTRVFGRFGFSGIFFGLLLGYIVVFLIALFAFHRHNAVSQERLFLRQTIAKMLREKNLLNIYLVSCALEFFYALMIVYTPLYLLARGFSWQEIGIIFTAMLVPFVLVQYPAGRLADTRWGEKELIIGSLLLAGAATAVLPFVHSQSVAVWGGLLFVGRIGIAGIEILRDSYFYKQVDADDMDVIAFFRTARPVANIAGAALSIGLLLVFSLQSIFFLAAGVLFAAVFAAFRLIDTQSERERIAG